MKLDILPPYVAALLSLAFLLGGVVLAFWSVDQLRFTQNNRPESIAPPPASGTPVQTVGANTTRPLAVSAEAPAPRRNVVLGVGADLPSGLLSAANRLAISTTHIYTAPTGAVSVTVRLQDTPPASPSAAPVYEVVYAAAARFDTIHPSIRYQEIEGLWQQSEPGQSGQEGNQYRQVAVLSDTIPSLVQILGPAGAAVRPVATVDALVDMTWEEAGTLALLPFDLLEPELAVLAVDGQTPIENANLFEQESYPLVHPIYATAVDPANGDNDGGDNSEGNNDDGNNGSSNSGNGNSSDGSAGPEPGEEVTNAVDALRRMSGGTNRRDDRLTVVAMTGVTAMVRQTAAQIEEFGVEWPAEVVGPELAAADVTAVSNEVPFVPDCEVDTSVENLTFCSPPRYLQTLQALGVDIVGLTGNHQNDFGTAGALASLDIYADAGIEVYGGGRDRESAFEPLYVEHNGNRLAFLGANSYGPGIAWASDNRPGSAEFDLNVMSATIRNVKEQGAADVVLAELQYQESYGVQPLFDQRQNFQALARAGADIVTGVQSHVPQSIEFVDGQLILYGLGNLFFDQMARMDTREGLIVKHTFYNGRHLSTQILTTLLYDYGQPRWTTAEEREALLERVFSASYWERPGVAGR